MHIISGKFKNQKLVAPKGQETRPTSSRLRESLFNICQSYIEEALFLDLFAGSGAIGFEALSRGAKSVTFVDQSKESLKAILENGKKLNCSKDFNVFQEDVFHFLSRIKRLNQKFDIIYIDPPYDASKLVEGHFETYSSLILKAIDESDVLSPNGELFIEDSKESIPNPETLHSLKLKSSRRLGRSFLQQWEKSLNQSSN